MFMILKNMSCRVVSAAGGNSGVAEDECSKAGLVSTGEQ